MSASPSLKRPLIIYPLVVHLGTLIVSFAILLAVAVRFDSGGPYADEGITRIIARAIARAPDGSLVVDVTPELLRLQSETPGLWFVVEDDEGQSVSVGSPPERLTPLVGTLSDLSYAQFRDRKPPYDLTAVLRRESAPAGTLTILAHGRLKELGVMVLLASNIIVLPIFLLLVLSSLLVTPWIVRRSLAGVSRISAQASQIDVARRGRRLSDTLVPVEIAPLVRAVNAALDRLDQGYEQQRRFIASAAHELRTPIAVLLAKVETASAPTARALEADVRRLSTLTDQLLDLQRLDHDRQDDDLDLSAVVRRTVADLAPLLVASGRMIEVATREPARVRGDGPALERVFTNLIQNAMEHGGQQIVVRIYGAAVEIEDDGPGIPLGERDRVFEPFHRLQPRSTGSGLGLSLVQQVVERHDGEVSIRSADGGGTIVRVDFKPPKPDLTGKG